MLAAAMENRKNFWCEIPVKKKILPIFFPFFNLRKVIRMLHHHQTGSRRRTASSPERSSSIWMMRRNLRFLRRKSPPPPKPPPHAPGRGPPSATTRNLLQIQITRPSAAIGIYTSGRYLHDGKQVIFNRICPVIPPVFPGICPVWHLGRGETGISGPFTDPCFCIPGTKGPPR